MGAGCCGGGATLFTPSKSRVAPDAGSRPTASIFACEPVGPPISPESEIGALISIQHKVFKDKALSSPTREKEKRKSLKDPAESWLTQRLSQQTSETPSTVTQQKLAAACGRNRLFALASVESRGQAASHMVAIEVEKGKELCRQGDLGANLIVLESGELSVTKHSNKVGIVRPWESVGELEIVCVQPRCATIRAEEASKVWVLGQTHTDDIRREIQEELQSFLSNKTELCRGQSKQVIKHALCVGVLIKINKAEQVMCAGDSALCVGIVVSGGVCEKNNPAKIYIEGNHFGQDETVNDQARKATFIANSAEAIVFMIDKTMFEILNSQADNKLSQFEQDCLAHLRTFPELEQVQTQLLVRMASCFKPKTFSAGESIVAGDKPDFVGIITKGQILRASGEETTVLGEGKTLNQAALASTSETEGNESSTDWSAVTMKAGDDGAQLATLALDEAQQLLAPSGSGLTHEGSKMDPTMCCRSLSDLEDIGLLGNGAYGHVRMVVDKTSKKVFALKSYNREKIVKMQVQKHVENEKLMMLTCNHPFVLKLIGTFEDATNWHMVLELVQGGDLFGRLDRVEKLDNHSARFYMAGTLLALEHLHQRDIVYRDLKPENLLIDERGYIKLADFGLAKKLAPAMKTFTVCGTPEYMSPELIGRKGHNKAVDYWSIGILIFEMLSGMPPFYDDNPMITYTKIFAGKITWPKIINSTAKDLIKRLLQEQPAQRLGCLSGGANDIKRHAWMAGFDFDACVLFNVKAPWVPKLKGDRDLSFFDP